MPEDLPLALRRPRRSTATAHDQSVDAHTPQTPSRGNKKRVRFSDPGPTTEIEDEVSASTGLTPSLRRTTLTPGSGSPSGGSKRRRHSGPAAVTSRDVFNPDRDTGYSGQVTFLPLRQVLDGRVKRRIRRNGLSEEMNVRSAEKRLRTQQTKAEMDALRAALAVKDAEIRRLSGATVVASEEDESIDDLKKQVQHLRQALKSPAPSHTTEDDYDTSGSTPVGTHYSSDCLEMDVDFDDDVEDHFFGEDSVAEIACSTPSRRPSDPRNSFPTPPSTSPLARLATPLFRKMVTPTSHAAVQVDVPDPDREELEEELASLHLEIDKLTGTLEMFEAMTSRLSDKLSRFAPDGGSAADAILGSRSPTVKVEAQLNKLLEAFSGRTAKLSKVDQSLGELGLAGDDASEGIASLATAFRSARLELEYLEPGESTLPLTATGAAVLDLLLTRLRELSRRNLESEEIVDEYHEVAMRLRKQLATRVEAMDEMRQEISTLKGKVKLRNVRIAELEAGMDKLRGTVKTYTRDIAELEALAQRLEGDLDTTSKDLQRAKEDEESDVQEWSDILKERDSRVVLLEEKLELALAQTSELKDQLGSVQRQQDEMQARHQDGFNLLSEQHGSELSLQDKKTVELRREINEMSEALRQAHETIRRLRVENGSLDFQLDAERNKARAVFDTMKAELDRAVRLGERLMASTPPKSPERD